MVERIQATVNSFRQEWLQASRRQPIMALALWLGLATLVALALASLIPMMLSGSVQLAGQQNLRHGFLGGMMGLAGTAAGAALALSIRSVSAKTEDAMLGFAAGMMLAAAVFSLIMPGLEHAATLTSQPMLPAIVVVAGLFLGVFLMLGLDRFVPHYHDQVGECGVGCSRLSKVWLFVLAIAIHNLPEGMAIGVGFANGDWSAGFPLASAIAIQDIPEGLAVALTLRAVGLPLMRSVLVAAATGLLEPIGAVIGWALTGGFQMAHPLGMGLAAGAMIFVVSHEVIPETHRRGHQTAATMGLMIGFAVMMFLDTALG